MLCFPSTFMKEDLSLKRYIREHPFTIPVSWEKQKDFTFPSIHIDSADLGALVFLFLFLFFLFPSSVKTALKNPYFLLLQRTCSIPLGGSTICICPDSHGYDSN